MSEQQSEVPVTEAAVETPATPVETPDAGTGTENTQPETAPVKDDMPHWAIKKIGKATAKLRSAEQERDAYRAELDRLRSQQQTDSPAQPTVANVDPIQLASVLKQQIRTEEASNRTYEAGLKEFSDFDAVCNTAGQHFKEEFLARPDFFEALNELPDAHKVYYALAKNPDELSRILEQPTAKMAVTLARKASEIAQVRPKAISNAPRPVTPIGGTARVDTGYRPDMSMEEYAALKRKSSG